MLDTNICIYIIKGKCSQILKKYSSVESDNMCISTIVLAELEFGISKSKFSKKNQLSLLAFLSGMKIVPFDERAAKEYGDIRADLERKGTPIGFNDMLIAANSRALNLTLVTNNVKKFSRVENLNIENWIK